MYIHNCNQAKFSNIFLHREQFGQSYAYDDDMNVVSTGTLAGQKSDIQYDSADNIEKYTQPGREKSIDENQYIFNYGSTDAEKQKHLLLRSRTPMKLTDCFTYDSYGNRLTSRRVDESVATGDQTSKPFIHSVTAYDANSNYAVSATDARGNTVSKSVDANTGLVNSVTDPEGQVVNYAYDAAKRVTSVQTTASGKTYKNTYTYEDDHIKTVSHNTTSDDESDVTYTFNYDALGRKTSVQVGEQTLSTNVYEDTRNGLLSEVRYGNDGKVSYTYDDFDRLTGVKYDGEATPRYTYAYGSNGRAAEVRDANLNRIARTEFDLSERPCQVETRDGGENLIYRTKLKYDKYSNLEAFSETLPAEEHATGYAYDRDNRITKITYDGEANAVEYTYDALGRITGRAAKVGENSYSTVYSYVSGGHGANSTTSLVAGITQPNMNFAYAYDTRGNIVSETRNGLVTTYVYDALGQLIRVNDPHESTTWVYNYDRGGNITSKVKYAYTTGTLGTAVQTIPYVYGDSNWKDKLTSYNGKTITYDAIGNPLNDGERTYTWGAGRQLRHISMPLTGVEHGFRVNHGVHADSNTKLCIVREDSKLKAKLLRDNRDVTAECAASAFVWTKNGSAAGTGKEIAVTTAEINGDVQFSCTYTETQGVYGTVQVNNNLVASHTPASADANHTFSLVNGMLNVEVPNSAGNGTDYKLTDGILSVNSGFTGSITAEYEFTTSPTREIDFKYNHNGLRTQKIVVENGVTTTYDYTLHGKLITHLTKRTVDVNGTENTEELHFFYDAQSKPAFVEHNGIMYRYIHNLQGDVVGLLDGNGNLVVEYKYDAWGRLLASTGTLKTTLGELNPFRYRGYVYDEETELYYLRSRYYCSTKTRYLNSDKLVYSGGFFVGFNMYAYCMNIPSCTVDPSGCRPIDALSVQTEDTRQRKRSMETMNRYASKDFAYTISKDGYNAAITVSASKKLDALTTEYAAYDILLIPNNSASREYFLYVAAEFNLGEDIFATMAGEALEQLLENSTYALTAIDLLNQERVRENVNSLYRMFETSRDNPCVAAYALVQKASYTYTEGLGATPYAEETYILSWDGIDFTDLMM